MSKLFVISAPSGAGKTSLIESLLENSPLKNLKLGISCTTRAKRENEVNGESYFFTTKYNAIKIEANSILYQTSGIASIEINFPKIAVNPQMKTIKCKWR